jgi:hypothetical protein
MPLLAKRSYQAKKPQSMPKSLCSSARQKPKPKPKPKPKCVVQPKRPAQTERMLMPKLVDDDAEDAEDAEVRSSFPDFPTEELQLRASHVTNSTARWAHWSKEPTTSLDQRDAYTVPAEIMNLIPACIAALMGYSAGTPFVVIRNIDVLEFCAGISRPCKWAHLAGLNAAAFDITHGKHMDALTDEGYALILTLLLRVKPGTGFLLGGPKCSSWGFLPRSVTKRSKSNTQGDETTKCVREGNLLNERCAFLCVLASLLKVPWVIEQPTDSYFFLSPHMRQCIERCGAGSASFPMFAFGHQSLKPTVLKGTLTNNSLISKLIDNLHIIN